MFGRRNRREHTKGFGSEIVLPLPVTVIPIVIYAYLVIHFSVNIPFWDDYDTVLAYLNAPRTLRHQHIFAQHIEHRLVWNRIVTEGVYYLLDEIDFEFLIYIGNLALLLLLLVFFQLFREQKLHMSLFVPIPYLLFQPQPWESMTWATASLQQYYVLLFVLLSLYSWNRRSPWRYGAAFGFAVAAVCTNGNGVLVFLVLLVWEVERILGQSAPTGSQKRKPFGKEHLQFFTLLVVAGCVLYLYFRGYRRPSHLPDIGETLRTPSVIVLYAGVLLGGYAEPLGRIFVVGVGILETAIFVFLTYRRYYRRNPTVYYFLLFLFLTVFAVAVARAGFGVDQALSSRYKILSILILALEYWALAEHFSKILLSRRWLVYCLLILTVGFYLGSMKVGIPELSRRKNDLIDWIRGWKQPGEGHNYPPPDRADRVLQESIEKGIYRPPDY